MISKISHGFIFKDVTGESGIPDNPVEIWEQVSKSKGKDKPDCKLYGNLSIGNIRGNKLFCKEYDIDIDSRL